MPVLPTLRKLSGGRGRDPEPLGAAARHPGRQAAGRPAQAVWSGAAWSGVFFGVVFAWVCICVWVGAVVALALAFVLVSVLNWSRLGCIVPLFRYVSLRLQRCGKRAKIFQKIQHW